MNYLTLCRALASLWFSSPLCHFMMMLDYQIIHSVTFRNIQRGQIHCQDFFCESFYPLAFWAPHRFISIQPSGQLSHSSQVQTNILANLSYKSCCAEVTPNARINLWLWDAVLKGCRLHWLYLKQGSTFLTESMCTCTECTYTPYVIYNQILFAKLHAWLWDLLSVRGHLWRQNRTRWKQVDL